MMSRNEHLTINGASIILAELCGVLLGLRRSEHFASAERCPDKTTLLCFKNLAGVSWDLGEGFMLHLRSRVTIPPIGGCESSVLGQARLGADGPRGTAKGAACCCSS